LEWEVRLGIAFNPLAIKPNSLFAFYE
jgi:hypothetical protein